MFTAITALLCNKFGKNTYDDMIWVTLAGIAAEVIIFAVYINVVLGHV